MALSNFVAIKDYFAGLANYGILAEKNIYIDSNTTMIKTGILAEKLVDMLAKYEGITYYSDKQVDRLKYLQYEGLIEEPITSILHEIRIKRNMATHTGYESIDDAKYCVEIAYSLCGWFVEVYGTNGDKYDHKPFVLPKEGEQILTDADESKQNELDKQENDKAKPEPKQKERKAKYKANHKLTEAETRAIIDEQLRNVGWEADSVNLRYSKGTRPLKGHNIAIAEWPTDSAVGNKGYADYALFIGLKLYGIIEAKAEHKNISSVIDFQGKDYAKHIRQEDNKYTLGTFGKYKVPFIFATNGRPYMHQFKTMSGIWFWDARKSDNVAYALQGWKSPLNLEEDYEKDIEAGKKELSNLCDDILLDKDGLNLRYYQINAIKAAECAVLAGSKSVLLAMATGTGKTRTVLGMIYRFLRTNMFKRILFLVDRTALGEQAQDVFQEVKLEDLMTLDNIYHISKLDDTQIDKETRVHVSTVQAMIKRLMYNGNELKPAVSDYDCIVIDEAHRGYTLDKEMSESEVYYRSQDDFQSKYRQVIDYFDAVKIALTATPALHTISIFGAPVYRYTYREAVIDGYLCDHDAPHNIKTKLSDKGVTYKKGDKVQVLNTATGKITELDLMEDEVVFDVDKFNKQIVIPEFNKVVLEEIASDIDPEAEGKTLIYAVDDIHADMIVDILKHYYADMGIPEEAIMKITGSVGGGNPKKIQEAIKRFKNEKFPSIVVTVDLLTTGIDVPDITKIVFMRRVKSRILFEQMLGRATRICPAIHKTHFEIYDPVGTYDALEPVSTMKPTVASNTVTFKELVENFEEQTVRQHEEIITKIIGKLQRKKRNMSVEEAERFEAKSGGKSVENIISYLKESLKNYAEESKKAGNSAYKINMISALAAEDSLTYEGKTIAVNNNVVTDLSDSVECVEKTLEQAVKMVVSLKDALVMLDKLDNKGKNIVIDERKDEVTEHVRTYGKDDLAPEDYLKEFTEYVKSHQNEVAALNIICTCPHKLTRETLKSLKITLDIAGFTEQQLNTAVSSLSNKEITADIISLVRRYAIGSSLVSHAERITKAVEKLKSKHKFTEVEQSCLKAIEEYLMNESVLNVEVFDTDMRFKGKIRKRFKHDLNDIVKELNTYLYEDKEGIS